MRKILIILLLTFNYSTGQVVLDSVAVTAEFKGTINKTILEIYALNTSENDSVEIFINFSINKNSIVENLWLEIDNELKSDITLSRMAGTTIYNRIVGRRIDPAYLVKNGNGNYQLRIFPINRNQKRKVVIEYYSILGGEEEHYQVRSRLRNRANKSKVTKDSSSLYWFINFPKEPTHKSIKVASTQPLQTIIDLSKIDTTQVTSFISSDETTIHNYESGNVDEYSILFNYKETDSITKYKNDSLECYSTNLPTESKINPYQTIQAIDQYNVSPPDFVKSLIQNVKEFDTRILYLNKARYNCNSFLVDMLQYIVEQRSNEIKIELRNITNRNNFDVWFYDDSTLVTEKLSFALKPPVASLSQNFEIECSYINKFFEYAQILYLNSIEQINSRYLTETLAKIVIEDDSLTQSIKDEVLERERLGELPQFENSEPVFFIAVEKMPEIVGGLDSIYSHLFFPAFADSMLKGERIFIKVTVNKVGEIVCNEILRSNNEIFSQIGSLAINLVDWLPAEQRGKPVAVQVSVPLIFNTDTLETISKKYYRVDNRNYIAKLYNNNLFISQEEFEFTEVEEVGFRTKRFYELLFDNPAIINFVYKSMYLSDIKKLGLVIKTKGLSKNVMISKRE